MSKNGLQVHSDDLRGLSDEEFLSLMKELGPGKAEELQHNWRFWARPEQIQPDGKDWNNWVALAGRGWGKTRSGAEWVREQIKSGKKRIAAVAPTKGDVRRVMVEGDSGLLSVSWKGDKTNRGVHLGYPVWSPTNNTISWANGAKVEFFSAEDPERLRGPQFEAAWCFVEGTEVSTPNGGVDVSDISVGDVVNTSKGPNKVIGTSKREQRVGEVIFSDGRSLVGTYEHPIKTQRGWVKLGELTCDDSVCALNASTTVGKLGASNLTVTTQQDQNAFTDGSTEIFSVTATDLTFTTKTGTRSTTPRTTYKNSHAQSISNSITGKEVFQSENLSATETFVVMGVERQLSGSLNQGLVSTVSPVKHAEQKKSVKSLLSVSSAEKSSEHALEIFALNIVSTWRPMGLQFVYNIQVENTPEYFANGILTHNCDEICAWRNSQDVWDMLQFTLRLGKHPRVFITTTPKPTKLIRTILADPKTVTSTGSTYDNKQNLAKTFLSAIEAQYEGTRLGRQELYAEVLDEASGALWTRSMLAKCEISKDEVPNLSRIVVAVDPAITSNEESDMTGIIVAGVDINGKAYVLADHTGYYSPQGWAAKAVSLYHEYDADRIVAEKNQGGDMVRHTLQTEDENIPIRLVHASRGKMARAEPVSALYEQSKVYHVQGLNELEDQMVTWEPLGSVGSPDRLDACVWALTDLILKGVARPHLQLVYSSAKGLK